MFKFNAKTIFKKWVIINVSWFRLSGKVWYQHGTFISKRPTEKATLYTS